MELMDEIITINNIFEKKAQKRINKLTKKITQTFLQEYNGDLNFETELIILCNEEDKEYFSELFTSLRSQGIKTNYIKLVLTDKIDGTYPLDYYERCKNSFWIHSKLWYALQLNAQLTEEAKTMLQQSQEPVMKLSRKFYKNN